MLESPVFLVLFVLSVSSVSSAVAGHMVVVLVIPRNNWSTCQVAPGWMSLTRGRNTAWTRQIVVVLGLVVSLKPHKYRVMRSNPLSKHPSSTPKPSSYRHGPFPSLASHFGWAGFVALQSSHSRSSSGVFDMSLPPGRLRMAIGCGLAPVEYHCGRPTQRDGSFGGALS